MGIRAKSHSQQAPADKRTTERNFLSSEDSNVCTTSKGDCWLPYLVNSSSFLGADVFYFFVVANAFEIFIGN